MTEAMMLIPDVVGAYNDCTWLINDVKKLIKLGKSFSSPYSIAFIVAKNLVFNYDEIDNAI